GRAVVRVALREEQRLGRLLEVGARVAAAHGERRGTGGRGQGLAAGAAGHAPGQGRAHRAASSYVVVGRPRTFQPSTSRRPENPWAPSNPSSTLYDGPSPAAVAARAAPIERWPERHRNTTGRSSPGVRPAS